MKIDIHITDCTPAEMAMLARVLGGADGLNAEIERKTKKNKSSYNRIGYGRNGLNMARHVYGIDRDGNWKEWTSIQQMTNELGVSYQTGRHSIDIDKEVNGYLLTLDRPAELGPEPEQPKKVTPEEVKAKIEEARQEKAEVEEVTVEPKGQNKARAVGGIHDNGKRKRWSSTTLCSEDLGVSYGTIKTACLHYKKVKGWMLFFDDEPEQEIPGDEASQGLGMEKGGEE